jgi:beta-lactamase regulating signal transducer with metallopeptidase domain
MNVPAFFDGFLIWMALSSVIILAAGIIALLLFRKSAAWRHQIWLNMLIGIWLLPTATWIVQEMNWNWTPSNKKHNTVFDSRAASTPATPTIEPALDKNETSQPGTLFSTTTQLSTPPTVPIPSNQDKKTLREWIHPAKAALFWTWLSGTLFLCSRWMIGWWRLRQIIRHSSPINQRTTTEILKRTVDNLDMKCCPRIHTSQQITTPMVIGTWNPSILLPFPQLQEISPPELEQILIHECAHIQRRDHWVWLLQRIGRTICWINPLYHWMHAELSRAREELCDNHVLQQWTGLDYAQTLAKVSNKWHQHDPMITGLAIGFRKHQLVHRVETLLDQTADHRSSLNPISQSAFVILFSALILNCALVTSGLTQEQTKNSLDDTPPDSAIETSKLRPYPNDIKAQKYLMSDGKDIHEVEYYPWVEESDYQRAPKSLLEIRQIPTFAWPSSKQPRIQVSGSFARNLGLTYNQVADLNTATTQAIHDFNMLKAHNLKFTYHSKKEKSHNGATIAENVNFEWYPKKAGLINSFREIRKRLETQVDSILGPERAVFFWKNDKNPSILSHLSDGALSENPDKKPYPNSFIFALQRFDSGLIITMSSGKIAGFNAGMFPEEFDIYLPEEMKGILAEWRQRVKNEPPSPEKIQELWGRTETNSEEKYPQPEEHDGVIWYEHANYIDISKTQLTLLEPPGLSIYNGISHIAASMLGLSDDDNRLLIETYHEFDIRFRMLQKQYMHSHPTESNRLQIDAFPNEASELRAEWLSVLIKKFGNTQAYSIDKLFRMVPNEYEIRRNIPASFLSLFTFPSRIWLNSGNDSILFHFWSESPGLLEISWAKSNEQQGRVNAHKDHLNEHQKRILRSLFNIDLDSE